MHINSCDIANDIFSNGQLWTWSPSSKYAYRMLSLMVLYIWSFLWFSFQLSSTQVVYSFTKWQWARGPTKSLRWRHNGCDSVSNHQPHDCLLKLLFRRRSKKTSKLRVTGLCVGNSPGTGEFPAQMASNAENVSIWWRHHVLTGLPLVHAQTHSSLKKAKGSNKHNSSKNEMSILIQFSTNTNLISRYLECCIWRSCVYDEIWNSGIAELYVL